jgi:hypothetical protein
MGVGGAEKSVRVPKPLSSAPRKLLFKDSSASKDGLFIPAKVAAGERQASFAALHEAAAQ